MVGIPANQKNFQYPTIYSKKDNCYFYKMVFFTATINNWQSFLNDDNVKEIIIDSLQWLIDNNKIAIHGFVIMPNHVHFLWTIIDESYDVAGRFKSYTGSAILKYLKLYHRNELHMLKSAQNDRNYQIWERRSKNIKILSREIAVQKLNYIHKNPLQEKWKLSEKEEDYKYSSAAFYFNNCSLFNFLSRYEDWI